MSGHQIKPASQLWKQNVQKVRPSLIFITCYPTSLPSIGFLLPFFIKWFYLLCLVWMEPGAVLSSGRVLSQKSEALFAFQPPSFFSTLDLICILFFSVLCFWNSACIPNGFNSPRGLFLFFPSFLLPFLPSFLPCFLPSPTPRKYILWRRRVLLIAKADVAPPKELSGILQDQHAAACRGCRGSPVPHISPCTPPTTTSVIPIHPHTIICMALPPVCPLKS